MKTKITQLAVIVLLTFCFQLSTALAQVVPQAINFQAIARDVNGNPMINTNIQIRLSVIDSALGGTIVYQELRALPTNAYGSFSFQIGVGANYVTIGSFQSINWETGNKHLKIDYDPTNTFNFTLTLGIIKFVTVPYAFTAETVVYIDASGAQNGDALVYNSATGKFEPGQVTTGPVDWSNVQNKPNFATVATSGNYNDLINTPIINGSETKVTAGTNITVTGIGTTANPYVINSTVTHYVGELYGGGVVFYVDQTGNHGLICSMIDLSTAQAWSNIDNTLIGATAQSEWNGQGNTTAIIGQPGHTSSAAKLCNDYININYGTGAYSDWYLPAMSQLNKLFNAIYEVNKSLDSDGNSATTLIDRNLYYYWSSTEYSNNTAWYYDFISGTLGIYSLSANKVATNAVRAVRAF